MAGADDLDVIVIGAGLSGLLCATRLVAGGARVRVLEARDRVGGRLIGVRAGDGRFDLGGQWWTAGQARLAALADELGVARAPQFRDGASILAVSTTGPARSLPGRLFDALARGRRLAALSRMIARAGAGDAPATWDGESLGAWLERELSDVALRAHVTVHCEMTFATDPHELSLLDYLAQLGATGGHGDPFDDKAGHEHRFVPGAYALPERLAAALGDRITLSTAVRAIDDTGAAVLVATDTGTLHAAHVVLALPPAAVRTITVSPGFPAAATAAVAATRPGPVVKCVAVYDRAFWRDDGHSGEAYLRPGLVRATVDACTHDGVAALAAFVVASDAATWSDAHSPAAVVADLARLYGAAAASPAAFAFHDWGRDAWSHGCVAGLPPGARTAGAAWRGRHGRLHIAGTEAAQRWPGFMEGAIDAAERTAAAILAG